MDDDFNILKERSRKAREDEEFVIEIGDIRKLSSLILQFSK